MKTCPACHREVPSDSAECPHCGVIYARFRSRSPPRRAPSPRPEAPPRRPRVSSKSSRIRRGAGVLVLGAVGGVAAAGGYWYVKIYPRIRTIANPYHGIEPGGTRRLTLRTDAVADFDRTLDLPGDPLGLVWNGRELIVGNRKDPFGFLRLSLTPEGVYEAQAVPVIEPTFRQRIGFSAVTWNGTHYVGYTDGSWFQSSHSKVFTLHDPQNLRVLQRFAAPDHLGGLTWDGTGYWAATRRNTRDSGEPAHLYYLDADFAVVSRTAPPGVGCQGLAWDGSHLWFVDVFSDALYLLAVRVGAAEVVQAYSTRFSYLSGIGFDGRNVWITEYDDNRLHRLNPRLPRAWLARHAAPKDSAPVTRPRVGPALQAGRETPETAALRRQLRSEDWAERMRAEMELRRLGAAIDYARSQDLGPRAYPDEETEIYDWAVEVRGSRLYGSWHFYFGDGLFRDSTRPSGMVSLPIFAKYTVTVEGGTLRQPREIEFPAQAGENRRQDVELATGLGPGKYEVSLFIHVQFVDSDGRARIWNQSGMTLEVEGAG